jgi:glycyl-tRNA synthetase beta chain
MPELLLELFSEEIPARMQARGAEDLSRVFSAAVAPVLEGAPRAFFGPRRIGLVATLREGVTTEGKEERGPRTSAPEAALTGFLRKHNATKHMLAEQNGFWVLQKPGESVRAREMVARAMPGLIRGFGWPKSMRWNGPFTWVRPLHRILCVLDGAVVPFGIEEVPGLVSGDLTEGHRIMSPGAFAVHDFASYEAGLRARHVLVDAGERMRIIEDGIAALAAAQGVSVVPDRGLLEEVAGLVEWPVPLLGRIDDGFMDLPPELMRTTMRVNQRYFTMVQPDGTAAPFFGLVANIVPSDGGATLIAGNERVLRARLSDARFFWDQDRKNSLESYLPRLDSVVFHAKLGTQGQRVARLERLARFIAPTVGADPDLAARAAKLAKADLATGLVGEFPELQGTIGQYYALHHGENSRVAEAIGTHYRPLGPSDAAPAEPVGIAVALADKLDTLAAFFAVGERPTGSGDPFALRRAALGIIKLVRENGLRVHLEKVIEEALYVPRHFIGTNSTAPTNGLAETIITWSEIEGDVPHDLHQHLVDRVRSDLSKVGLTKAERGAGLVGRAAQLFILQSLGLIQAACSRDVLDFLLERLRVQLRAEGGRHDLVAASIGSDDDILRILARAEALKALVEGSEGTNLLAAYKRAQNILRIEDKKDGPHTGAVNPALLTLPEEHALAAALDSAEPAVATALAAEDYQTAMSALAALRPPLDAFFERVIVNDPDNSLRLNRLRLLARLRGAMDGVADFSKIEG